MKKRNPVLKRVLKWSGLAALGLLVLVCALWALAFAINARDEELSAQARALLAPPPNPYASADNLYVAFAGFDAPPGQSVIAHGEAKIRRYEQQLPQVLRDPSPATYPLLALADPRRLEFLGDTGFIQPADGSVWDAAARHGPQVAQLLADNRELYQRYIALEALHGYYETARLSYLGPTYAVPNPVRKLFLAEQARRLHEGAPARQLALEALANDLRLWRAVLTGHGTLISKALAIAALQADYLLLADLIADPAAELPLGEHDADAVVPLFELREWNVGPALAAEFRLMSSVFAPGDGTLGAGPPPRLGGWISGRFFKVNATENLLARQTARRMAAAADPALFARTRDEPGVWLPESAGVWSWPLTYNPFGKTLAAIANPLGDNYVLRAWDGAALQRLVRLGYEIRRQRIEAAAVPAFLGQHREWSTHPADGRPFLFDAGSGELKVQTVARQQPGRRFAIRIWRAGAP